MHGRALLAYASHMTGARWAAEDAVQETLIRAWRHRTNLTHRSAGARSWLFTVLRNVVIDGARARGTRPREVPQEWAGVPVQRDHADHIVDTFTLRPALGTLPVEQRTVLEHLYLRSSSVVETAQALGIPVGTVKSRSHYALRALRRHLAGAPTAQAPVGTVGRAGPASSHAA